MVRWISALTLSTLTIWNSRCVSVQKSEIDALCCGAPTYFEYPIPFRQRSGSIGAFQVLVCSGVLPVHLQPHCVGLCLLWQLTNFAHSTEKTCLQHFRFTSSHFAEKHTCGSPVGFSIMADSIKDCACLGSMQHRRQQCSSFVGWSQGGQF